MPRFKSAYLELVVDPVSKSQSTMKIKRRTFRHGVSNKVSTLKDLRKDGQMRMLVVQILKHLHDSLRIIL